jgi:hypothetical protein
LGLKKPLSLKQPPQSLNLDQKARSVLKNVPERNAWPQRRGPHRPENLAKVGAKEDNGIDVFRILPPESGSPPWRGYFREDPGRVCYDIHVLPTGECLVPTKIEVQHGVLYFGSLSAEPIDCLPEALRLIFEEDLNWLSRSKLMRTLDT